MVDTRNLSVLFTDIKGFTARTAKSTREDLVALLKRHEEIVLPRAAARGGTLIKAIGDAFLFTFESPTNAVVGAIEVQNALRDYNAKVDAATRIEVRMGINAGEVTMIEGDVYGDAVNIAARVESIAEAGEIFFSEAVYLTMNKAEVEAAMGGGSGFNIAEVGYQTLKGVAEPVRVYKVHRGPPGLAPRLNPNVGGTTAAGLPALGRRTGEVALENAGFAGLVGSPSSAGTPMPGGLPRASSGPHSIRARTGDVATSGRWLRGLTRIGALVATLGALALLGTAGVLHTAWGALFAALIIVAVHPFAFTFGSTPVLLSRAVGAGLFVILGLAIPDAPLRELQARFDELDQVVDEGGVDKLGTDDLLAAYAANLLLAARHRVVGYPEAASLQLGLFSRTEEARQLESEQPMRSLAVVAPLADFAARLRSEPRRSGREESLGPVEVHLRAPPEPPRLVMAFEPLTLGATAVRDGQGAELRVTGEVQVAHGRRGRLPLTTLRGATLTFPRALGWALQKRGWLFPYTANVVWTLRADDPRLMAATVAKGK